MRPEVLHPHQENKEIDPNLPTGIIFAGQGQDPEKLCASSLKLKEHPAARPIYDQFDDVLHDVYPEIFKERFSRSVLEEGSPETHRENLQLLVVQYNLGCESVLRQQQKQNGFPDESKITAVSGQSLGFIPAATVSGAIDIPNTAILVKERQDAMSDADGTLAFFRANYADERIMKLMNDHNVKLSIITSEDLVVLGGSIDEINKSIADARSQKITARSLETKGAFHTSDMEKAARHLAQVLPNIATRNPVITLLANTNGEPIRTAEELNAEIINQIPRVVVWLSLTDNMMDKGVKQFLEIGNEGMLTGLIQKDLVNRTGDNEVVEKRQLSIEVTDNPPSAERIKEVQENPRDRKSRVGRRLLQAGAAGAAAGLVIGSVLLLRHVLKDKNKS